MFRAIEATCGSMTHKLAAKKENILREREEALESVLGELSGIAKTHPREVQKALKIVQATSGAEPLPGTRPHSSSGGPTKHSHIHFPPSPGRTVGSSASFLRISSPQPKDVLIRGTSAKLRTQTKGKGLL